MVIFFMSKRSQCFFTFMLLVAKDAVMEKKSCKLKRRHTIMGCESPGEDKVLMLPTQQELPLASLQQHDSQTATRTEKLPMRKHGVCAKSKHSHLKMHGNSSKRRLSSPEMPVCPHGGNLVPHKSHVKACAVHSPHSPCSHRTISNSIAPHSETSSSMGLSAIPEDVPDSSLSTESSRSSELKESDQISELNATTLLHVSWKTTCSRSDTNHPAHCRDCRPIPVSI